MNKMDFTMHGTVSNQRPKKPVQIGGIDKHSWRYHLDRRSIPMLKGKIRVSAREPNKNPFHQKDPIVISFSDDRFKSLDPRNLKDDKNRILYNIFEFSKVHEFTNYCRRFLKSKGSKISRKEIWEHKLERHAIFDGCDDQWVVMDEYVIWRIKGFCADYAIEDPSNGSEPLFYLKEDDINGISAEKIDIVRARKEIIWPYYLKAVQSHSDFIYLCSMLNDQNNILIITHDHEFPNSVKAYSKRNDVKDRFISKRTILINEDSLKIFVNQLEPFPYEYYLAAALLGVDISKL